MVKKALKSALPVGIGVSIGGVLLPRVLSAHLYNETYPSIFSHVLLHFVVASASCFFVFLLIYWAKSKEKKGR